MAEEKEDQQVEEEEQQPVKSSSNKKSIILIAVAVILGLSIAGGISYFVAMKILEGNAGAHAATAASKRPSDAVGEYIKIGDPKEGIIVNIGGVNSGRYLKINMTVEVEPPKEKPAKGAVDPNYIKIQDVVVQFLRSRKIEDFAPDKQEQLKKEVKKAVENVIGANRVYDVYITNFVLQ